MATAAQMLGSLLAILALAWLARHWQLGGDTRIVDHAHARALAQEALCGFDPVEVAVDRAGQGALLRDGANRVLLLRKHGSHFAARLLGSASEARLDRHLLTITPAERTFGSVTFDLGDAAAHWAAQFRHVGKPAHA